VSLLLLASSWSVVAWDSFSSVGYEAEDLLSEERLLRLFESWQSRHGKLYHSLQEKAKRLEIFRSNLEYIDAHNRNRRSSKKGSRHWLGLNKFADLTNEEFKAIYSSKPKKSARSRLQYEQPGLDTCDAPSSLDWRKKGVVTGVKNQGQCGSCWAFSVTGAIEAINGISTGDLESLSEQQLVDCDSTNFGCVGGFPNNAFEWVIHNYGINREADYPYTSKNGTCNNMKEGYKVVTIDGYTDVEPSDSAVLCAVVQQPISVGMVGSAMDFQLYSKGIYDGNCSSNSFDIDHVVLIVGYSYEDEVDYWIVKNSWGTDWGLDGYFYIERNTDLEYGVCAINAMASYPTKEGTSPSPEPSPAAA
jgi:C1A family cysteine protease